MKRIKIPSLLCLALLTPFAALAASSAQQPSSAATVSGAYSLTFHLNIASTLPAGTTITCRARIMPGQGGLNLHNPQAATAAVETAAGIAAIAGPAASCATEIPFSWTVTSAQSGVMLSYEIDAVSNTGSAPLLVRSSAQQNINVAFPASGQSVKLRFDITL